MSLPEWTLTSLYQSKSLLPYGHRLIHGFTGKPWSLGGPDTSDNPHIQVLENRQALLKTLGQPDKAWQIPEQVHGHRIGRTGDPNFCQSDGILLTQPEIPVMLLFADCVPVMLYDPERHAGAVLHAGWRGTAQKIGPEGVLTLQSTVNSRPQDIRAVIGPAISLCCFQVSLEVAQTMAEALNLTLKDMEAQAFLVWDNAFPENPRLDLKAINRYQLQQAGIEHVEILPHCPRCNTEALFSHRRGENSRNSAFMLLL